MKLIIQIPCYNESQTLSIALAALPRTLEGVDQVEWLVIDDGSDDNTSEIARQNGVDHIIRHPQNMGLARAFMTGLNACLEKGADIIVNTDADNQYNAFGIPDLIEPVIAGRADMTIGQRPIQKIEHFSPLKKMLQRLGSWVVRKFSGLDVADAPCGFRALSRQAAVRMNVFSDYTYTLETIIQAGQNGMVIENVPIQVNDDLRPSRLFRSIRGYISRSILTICRVFIIYRPLRTFAMIGTGFLAAGFAIAVRFLYFYLTGSGDGHIQSLILAAVLLLMGFQCLVLGVLSDVVSVNRKLLEDIQWRIRELRSEGLTNDDTRRDEIKK